MLLIAPEIAIVSGNAQTAAVNAALQEPIVVGVTDGSSPLSNYPVTFAVTGGGGALSLTEHDDR